MIDCQLIIFIDRLEQLYQTMHAVTKNNSPSWVIDNIVAQFDALSFQVNNMIVDGNIDEKRRFLEIYNKFEKFFD